MSETFLSCADAAARIAKAYSTPVLTEKPCGNVYRRPMEFEKAGDVVSGHAHNYDHATFVYQGSVHLKAVHPDGRIDEYDYKAPAWVDIKAEVEHEFTALEDRTRAVCIFAIRDFDGEVSQSFNGDMTSYV